MVNKNILLTDFSLLSYSSLAAGKKPAACFGRQDKAADNRPRRFFYLCIRDFTATLFYWVAVCGRACALPVPLFRSTNPHTCRPPAESSEGAEILQNRIRRSRHA